MSYLKRHGTRRVPQWAPIPGSDQLPNSAGGFAWAVDDGTRLRRFLILGSEGGSYYASEWTLTRENAQAVERCLAEDGPRAVAEIVRVSEEGRAPKNDPAIFALAMAAGLGDEPTRKAALEALPRVARTGTHLFQFALFVEGFRGWGRSLRRAVGRWYAAQPVDALAYQAVKPEHLTSPEVWEALLENLPMTALIRNLATMTRVGVLAPGSDGTAKAIE